MTPSTDSTPTTSPSKRASAWRRGAIGASLVAGGFILGAVSLASASGDMPWHGGGHHGPRVGMIQFFVHGALENVGATSAQETKIHDIIAATYTDLDQGKTDREALRKQVLDLMRAPTIDRAAVEKLRADQIASLDAKSKKVIAAVLDAASQLTPEQRVKLADQAQERMAHRGWGGWHHDGGMGDHDGPNHDGPNHDGGPDHGPDDRGDHG